MLERYNVVIFITIPSKEEAEKLSKILLEKRLIACCNIVPRVNSLYWWQGKIERDSETLMILKSRGELFPRLVDEVNKHHPYDVPEVIAFPIIQGNPDYLKWLWEETSNTKI